MIKGTIGNDQMNAIVSGPTPEIVSDIVILVKHIYDSMNEKDEACGKVFEAMLKEGLKFAFMTDKELKDRNNRTLKEREEESKRFISFLNQLLGEDEEEINVKSSEGDFTFRMPTDEKEG